MSKKLPIIAISISTGWAVRNYFQTGIINKLQESFKVLIITTPVFYVDLIKQGYGSGVEFIVRENIAEPLMWRLIRQLKKKIYMESRRSNTEVIWEKYVKRPIYQILGGKVVRIILKAFNANKILKIVEYLGLKINKCKETDNIFNKYQPVLYFATHASTYFEDSLLQSALIYNVQSVFMVLSWDHLSSKVILSSKYKAIYVWNNITKMEILETCSSYTQEQIKVVGIPQYDIYKDKPKISYKQWCDKYGLNHNKRTILFSTMPQVRHEQQHLIVKNILLEIANGKVLPDSIQLLVKCHPFDNEGKYDNFANKDSIAVCNSTLKKGLAHEQWFPSIDEMEVSRDALFFSEININIFSTVTLEAAYYNKPIIHIAFDPLPVSNRIPCFEYYNFEHFKNITKSKASVLVYSYDDLYRAINVYLRDNSKDFESRKNLVDQYFTVTLGNATDNVVKALTDDCIA